MGRTRRWQNPLYYSKPIYSKTMVVQFPVRVSVDPGMGGLADVQVWTLCGCCPKPSQNPNPFAGVLSLTNVAVGSGRVFVGWGADSLIPY